MAKDKLKVNKGSPVDCLAIGEKVLASFTRNELQNYVDEVIERAQSYQNLKGEAAMKSAILEINDDMAKNLFGDCKTRANNVAKTRMLKQLIKKGIDLRKILTPRGKANQSNNVWQSQRAAKGLLFDSVFKDMLSKEQNYFYDPKNEMDIASAMDGDAASDTAKSIAKKLKRYIETRNGEAVRTDALSASYISDYRYLDHMHDASAMISGGKNIIQRAKDMLNGVKNTISDPKQAWVYFIKKLLDEKNPISGANINGDDKKLHKVLEHIYDNITQNRNRVKTASIVVNDLDAIKAKQLLKLNFKDWKSFIGYNKVYGHGNLLGSLISDIQGSGARIGMADLMGSSPKSSFLDLSVYQEKIGIPGKKYLNSPGIYQSHNDYIFQSLIGMNQQSVAPKLTNFLANIRSLTSMARLLKLGILSTPDIAHGISYMGRFGNSMFKDFGYYLTNLWNNPVGNVFYEDRKIIAKQFHLMLDSHLGYVARMIDANNAGQAMNRLTNNFFKITLLEALDKGNKISTLHLMADTLGRNSKISWEKLPEDFKKQISNHNITDHEWNLLRTKTKGKLFSLDNVDAVTDDELRSLKSDVPLLNRRSDLYRKVYALFDNSAQQTVLSPTAWSKGMIYRGTSPGTINGEILRMVGQFKMYPVDYLDRVWMQGFNNADGLYAKLSFGIKLIAATMPLSYLSMWFDHASQGKSMPDPEYMTFAQKMRFYTSLAAPGVGIFLSLMDARNQNKNLAWSLIRSPSTDLIGDSLSSILAITTGNLKQAKKELGNVGKSISPVDTVPFISPFLREMLGEKPYLQPGQKQLFGA